MRILLATDGSTFSDAAVKEVARKPWPPGSTVRIISIVEPPILPTIETWVPPENYYEAIEKAAEDQARKYVESAAQIIKAGQGSSVAVETDILRGHPRQAIVEESDEWIADLIVVGSHGYRGLTRLWLGSVSQAVASHAKCSVEIVRARRGADMDVEEAAARASV
jgi:nucleotide-binding universal stress UspA family protein